MHSSDNIVQVWMERSADYADHAEMSGLETLLSEDERSRARKFIHAQDQRNFIVAHALKRKRIAEKLGISAPALRFERAATGKPYSLDADIHFNLSHSHGITALAISTVAPCGVDIEIHRPIKQLSMLIEKTMTSDEQSQIETAPSRLKAFMDRWVLKEAFLKLSGLGLAVPLASICTVSEIVNLQSCFGVLRGAPLFFKRAQDYSLAASSTDASGFDFIEIRNGGLLST